MILLPGGVYILGRNDGSQAEAPAVQVQLPPFYIDRHEVTVEQYELYRADATRRGERVYPTPEEMARTATTPRHPAVMINFLDATNYARWAGKSLPSEAQWEAAARGADARIRPWGGGPAPWGGSRAFRQIDPVVSFPADTTPLGVSDLAANAWEWTSDWYEARYHEVLARETVVNPGGPSISKSSPPQRSIKGSSRSHDASYREGMRIDARLPYLGFRCALSVGGTPQTVDSSAPAAPSPGQPAAAPGGGGTVVPF
jgi:formylglycine-generating enzyme required for sulfatase activity